jgi:two-component system OmpR family response regulator
MADEIRVLVVDDEQYIADLVSMALKVAGFAVQSAGTARTAINDFRPLLVVLDVGLPDQDGFELVQRLRTDGIKVPVIFLTARDATEEKVHGLTVGGNDAGRLPGDQPVCPGTFGVIPRERRGLGA